MPIIILGVVIVLGVIVVLILRSRSIKSDNQRMADQSKRRNDS